MGPKRRAGDNPDWKQAAPRWVLIIGALAGVSIAAANVRAHISKTDDTAARVQTIAAQAMVFQRGLTNVSCQLLDTRIDMLRYQVYMTERNGDTAFAASLAKTLQAAEQERLGRIPFCLYDR